MQATQTATTTRGRVHFDARVIATSLITDELAEAGLIAADKPAFAKALFREEAREGDLVELAVKLEAHGLIVNQKAIEILGGFDSAFLAARDELTAQGGTQ